MEEKYIEFMEESEEQWFLSKKAISHGYEENECDCNLCNQLAKL